MTAKRAADRTRRRVLRLLGTAPIAGLAGCYHERTETPGGGGTGSPDSRGTPTERATVTPDESERDFLFSVLDRAPEGGGLRAGVFQYRFGAGGPVQLTPLGDAVDVHPVRSEDALFFTRYDGDRSDVYRKPLGADPSTAATRLTDARDDGVRGYTHPFVAPFSRRGADDPSLYVVAETGAGHVVTNRALDGTPLGGDDGVVVDHGDRTVGHTYPAPASALPVEESRVYLASDERGGRFNVYSVAPDGSDQTRLTDNSDFYYNAGPTVGRDAVGRPRVAFTRQPDPNSCFNELWHAAPDGTDERRVTDAGDGFKQPIALQAGRLVYASDGGPDGLDVVYSTPLDGSGRSRLVDGRTVAVAGDGAEFQHRLKENVCGGSADAGPEFAASPQEGPATLSVEFAASSQRYPKAEIHFGDGATETVDTGSTTRHDYEEEGTYRTSCVFNIPACAPNGTKTVTGPTIEVTCSTTVAAVPGSGAESC